MSQRRTPTPPVAAAGGGAVGELLFVCCAHGQNMCGNTRHMVDERGRWHCVACGARWRTRFHMVMKFTIGGQTSYYKVNEELQEMFLRGIGVDIAAPLGDWALEVRRALEAVGGRLPDDVLDGDSVRREHIGLFLLV
jgi:hypothetical protein